MEIKKIEINMNEFKNPEELTAAIAEAIGEDVAKRIAQEVLRDSKEARIALEARKAWELNKEGITESIKMSSGGKLPEGEELLEIAFALGYCACADKEFRKLMMEEDDEEEDE